jgi:enterochelin esterase family protein
MCFHQGVECIEHYFSISLSKEVAMNKLFTTLFVLTFLFTTYSQDTLNVPADYTTIQAAIYAATNGDIVLVAEDTYYENIKFKGKAITVASHFLIDGDSTHIESTIIDGSQPSHPDSGSVVSFVNGEDTTSVLYGFTITAGIGTHTPQFSDRSGGGIYLYTSGAKICNNIIEDNSLDYTPYVLGGGIVADCGGKNLIIRDNIIRNNTVNSGNAAYGGGILFFADGYTHITNNKIIGNILTAPFATGGGIDCNGSSSEMYIINNYIRGNVINSNNSAGGGIEVYICAPVIMNNLIVDNSAYNGGGIMVELGQASLSNTASSDIDGNYSKRRGVFNSEKGTLETLSNFAVLVNNTIVGNSVYANSGAGITCVGPPVSVLNTIVWGNHPTNTQIDGSLMVTYSDIQGGYAGFGNIDYNPDFTDTVNYYLNITSPCVDAGNPDSAYNDFEDPGNPGFALWPALGTLHNDMGAYGGHFNTSIQNELLGPQFRAFVNRVNSVPVPEKQAIIDSFMNAAPSFPFIEENTIVYYIYQGGVGSVTVPGDANNWDTYAFPMTKLDGTIFWYREAIFESDARLDYKFVLNGNNWILDPLNPNTVSGGFGPNSELAMPDYVQPPEIEYYPNIPHGTLDTFPFTSDTLGNTRTIRVYTPPGYDSHPTYSYPVMLFHDGAEYLTLGSAVNILDYLLSENKMNPIIAVFVPPVNRDNEYAFNLTQQFESFIVDELMPHIDATYRTHTTPDKRAMVGLSFGGLITTQICYNNPNNFGLSAPYSPSYWAKNMEVFNSVLGGPTENIKWYLDWGSYEPGIMLNARLFREGLTSKGYEFMWNEWHEGHSWGSWRAHF